MFLSSNSYHRTPQEIFNEELNVLRAAMTQYMKQRRFQNKSDCEDLRFIIENPADLLGGITKILLKDLASVDASIKQMEDLCIRQGIEIEASEAGPQEIQNSVDWLCFHINARVSGESNILET